MIFPQIFKKLPTFTIIIAIIAFLSFFRGALNIFLNSILVKPLISEFENTIFNSLILIVLAGSVLLWLTIYGSKLFVIQLGIVVLGFYILMNTSKYWVFYRFQLYPILSSWDILTLGFVLPMLFSFIKIKSIVKVQNSNGFLEDLPIDSVDGDSFNRISIAKEIGDKINITSNKKSFAIGILGDYGSGKTSFMNLIKANLDTKNISVVEFNPWGVDGKSNIQQDFFDLLSSNLYRLDPKISGLVLDYSRKLGRTSSTIEKVFKHTGIIGSLFHESNYIDDYDRINHLLERLDKKIVIIIDDLDRLYSEEVLEVFRIIRNTANFANIFYLVAYDKGYVNKAINTISPNSSSSYIDKIIQLEIPLPKRDVNDLHYLLAEYFKRFLCSDDLKVFSEDIITRGFQLHYQYEYSKIFRQSRDVIKFVNGFKLVYSKLKEEVFFESLFILELLKFRFPLIYDRLYENRKEFIHAQSFAALDTQFYELNTYKEEKENKISIIQVLKNEKEYNDDELKLIEGLLHHLFFGWEKNKNAKNSIIHPMFFERYFRYRLGGKEISEKFFNIAFDGGLEKMKELINIYAEKNMLRETAARLLQLKVLSRSEFELKIKSLIYLGPKYASQEGLRNFIFDSLVDLLWDTEYNTNLKFYKADLIAFKSLVKNLFEEASFPYLFHNELIYHIRKGGRNFPLSDQELTDIQIKYFEFHLEKDGLSDDAVYIFYWTSYVKFEPLINDSSRGHKRHTIKDKMADLIVKVLPLHDPTNFLKMSIHSDFREKTMHTINWTFLNLFDNPKELREIVFGNNKISKDVKEEYLEFFDICQVNGFERYTEFEFKTELKNKIKTSVEF